MFGAGTALQALALLGAGVAMTGVAASAAHAQDYTSGAISGTVTDESGNTVSGATVTATSTGQGFTRTTTSGANGTFRFSNLAPGAYDIEVQASGQEAFKAEGVQVVPSQTRAIDVALSSSEAIVVTGAQVARDFTGAQTGVTVDVADFVKDKPLNRDLTSVVLLSPGTTLGDDGFGNLASINGASVGENAYYINGLNTTNFDNYLGSANVPFEFYRSVEVKTGGYSAEFGRSTGGIVNAVSKSGTNDFVGGVHLNWSPEFLRSKSPELYDCAEASCVRSRTNRGFDKTKSYSAILEAGGPIIKDRLFAYGLVEFAETETLRVNRNTRLATQLKKNDPVWALKLDAYPIDDHHLEFTIFDTRQTEQQTNFRYSENAQLDGALGASQAIYDRRRGGVSFVGKYTGNITDWLTVSGAYGRVRDRFEDIGVDAGSSNFFYQNASGAPVNGVNHTGLYNGQTLTNRDFPYTTEREFYRADVDLFFDLMGEHHIRAGFDQENNLLRHVAVRNGGDTLNQLGFLSDAAYNANLGGAGAAIILRPNNVAEVNYYNSGGGFDATNKAFYIQDEWRVTDRLTLNLGVRRDDFQLFKPGGARYVSLKKNYSPRLSATYEMWDDGSGKLFGSYGTYHLPVASNTAFRQASPELFFRERFNYNGFLANGLPNITTQITNLAAYQGTCPFALTPYSSGQNCNVTGNGTVPDTSASLSSSLKATKDAEWIVGYKHDFGQWTAGITYTNRRMKRSAEDVAVDAAVIAYCAENGLTGCEDTWSGFHQYVIVNPGKDATFALAGQDGRTVTISAEDLHYPKATRKFDAVEFALEKKWNGTWSAKGSYLWSKSRGNSEGFVQSDFEQDDSGVTQDFDQPGFTQYAYGYLPNDRRHRFKLEGVVALSDEFTMGVVANIESPRSLSCIGFNPNPNYFDPEGEPYSDFGNAYGAASHYCNGEPAPRGKGLKTHWRSLFDVAARWNVPFGDRTVTLRADVYNLFNSKSVTGRDEIGELVQEEPNPRYGMPTSYELPRRVKLGVDIAF